MSAERKNGVQPVYPELLWKLKIIQGSTGGLSDVVRGLFGLETIGKDAEDIVMRSCVILRETYGYNRNIKYEVELTRQEAFQIIEAMHIEAALGEVKAIDLLDEKLKKLLRGEDRTGRYELLV